MGTAIVMVGQQASGSMVWVVLTPFFEDLGQAVVDPFFEDLGQEVVDPFFEDLGQAMIDPFFEDLGQAVVDLRIRVDHLPAFKRWWWLFPHL